MKWKIQHERKAKTQTDGKAVQKKKTPNGIKKRTESVKMKRNRKIKTY